MAFPSTDSEEWRYSRIGDLDLEQFAMIQARDADAAQTTDEIPLAVSDFIKEFECFRRLPFIKLFVINNLAILFYIYPGFNPILQSHFVINFIDS